MKKELKARGAREVGREMYRKAAVVKQRTAGPDGVHLHVDLLREHAHRVSV